MDERANQIFSSCYGLVFSLVLSFTRLFELIQWRNQGRGPGSPLILRSNWGLKGWNSFFGDGPPLISGSGWPPPPPPSPIISQSRDTALGLEVWRTVTGEVPSPEKKQQNRLINLKLVKRSQTRQTRHYSSGLFWEERIVWRFWRTEKNSWEPVIIYRLGAGGGGGGGGRFGAKHCEF